MTKVIQQFWNSIVLSPVAWILFRSQPVTSWRCLDTLTCSSPHISLNDDDDIKREIQNLYIRTNMVISRFRRCSTRVKRVLFRSYCLCFYDIALWKHYSVTVLSKFKSCYHKCIKKLFGFSRSDSMSGILMQLSLPSFDTIIHNSRVLFESHCSLSGNTVTMHLCSYS